MNIFLPLMTLLLSLYPMLHCQESIIIRPAQPQDLSQLAELTHSIFYDDLKPILLKGYTDRLVTQLGLTDYALDLWIEDRKQYAHNACKNNLKKQENVIVALLTDNKTVVGICNFEKQKSSDHNTVFISLLGVNSAYRTNGVGTKLLQEAITTFDDVDTCELTTLAYSNDAAQNFYVKRGFINQGLTTISWLSRNTHFLYQMKLKK